MRRNIEATAGLLLLAALCAAAGLAQAAEANPADMKQADKFLAQLPKTCGASSKSVADDGSVNIRIKCDGNGKKMDGLVAIKDGIVTKVE
ncbi:PepSY domain-containing protein [Solimonas soli]|uniref:PepSY domain-containing protein n=1 Tax=Solimonas soli TaxID=413479 RepID=UPI000483B4B2|nr:PepSY domain-containing protein [Solimonas soli]